MGFGLCIPFDTSAVWLIISLNNFVRGNFRKNLKYCMAICLASKRETLSFFLYLSKAFLTHPFIIRCNLPLADFFSNIEITSELNSSPPYPYLNGRFEEVFSCIDNSSYTSGLGII